jgi:predicted ATPase
MELLLERIDRSDLLDDAVEVVALLQICQSLDGLPLALELAAARCVALQPSDVASRLGSHLRLLADSRRPEVRHQTVRATIEWSHDLLDQRDRLVFERLGVCAGWDLDAAEAICADSNLDTWDVDEAVAALVDKSLVEHEGRRYRMLETTRAFALDRLASRSDLERRQDLHRVYFADFVRRAMAGLRGPDEARWVDLLDADWSNIRSAFRRAMDTGDADAASAVVAHLTMEGIFRRPESLSWAREARARFGDQPQSLGHVLLGAVSIAE